MRLIGTSGNGVVNAIDRLIVPAWLRVSMGGTRSTSSSLPAAAATSGRQSGRSLFDLDSTNTLDPLNLVTRNQAIVALSNNLPSLNSQPLRFEQPTTGGSSVAAPQANSFTLSATDGGRSAAADFASHNNNNLDISFDQPTRSFESTSSPFLRLNQENKTFSSSRSPSNPFDSFENNSVVTTNQTKNMQLIEKLTNLMKARKFAKYLLRSGLSQQLKPDMNYVILVPTDQAVERLPKQIVDMLDRDPERLIDLVKFHVLDTTFEYINTIPDGQTLNTLNEKDILFNWHRNNTILTASGAVVMGGIQDENIALLIVDRVLYPTPGDLLSIVTKSPILSNFTNLIRNAGLERQLSLAGPFTLFAPSDFAFNQLDKRDLDFLQNNRDSARRFLLRHLSQPAIFTSSIALSNATDKSPGGPSSSPSSGSIIPLISVTNSLGEELTLRQKNDYFSVNDVNFSYADVAATNGVVHVIDGLL